MQSLKPDALEPVVKALPFVGRQHLEKAASSLSSRMAEIEIMLKWRSGSRLIFSSDLMREFAGVSSSGPGSHLEALLSVLLWRSWSDGTTSLWR